MLIKEPMILREPMFNFYPCLNAVSKGYVELERLDEKDTEVFLAACSELSKRAQAFARQIEHFRMEVELMTARVKAMAKCSDTIEGEYNQMTARETFPGKFGFHKARILSDAGIYVTREAWLVEGHDYIKCNKENCIIGPDGRWLTFHTTNSDGLQSTYGYAIECTEDINAEDWMVSGNPKAVIEKPVTESEAPTWTLSSFGGVAGR